MVDQRMLSERTELLMYFLTFTEKYGPEELLSFHVDLNCLGQTKILHTNPEMFNLYKAQREKDYELETANFLHSWE
jgi:hypothetical protein